MRILVAIYLVLIVAAMAAHCSLGHGGKRKFRNENPKVQMVKRCFNALKREKLEVKARYLCHALIKTFLLEQQLIINPSLERIMSRSGEESDVSI